MKRSNRIAVTLVSLLVVNTMFTAFFIQIDSFSYDIWEYETEVGPSTFFLRSSSFIPDRENVSQIDGVEKVEDFVKAWASVIALPVEQVNETRSLGKGYPNNSEIRLSLGPGSGPIINTSVDAVANDPGFFEAFPTIFNLTDGHWPEAENEIAFSEWVAIRFNVGVGDIVTYEFVDQEYHTLIISGVYSHPETENRNRWYYEIGDVVVQPEYFGEKEIEYYMYIEADRSLFSPLLAIESMSTLSVIADEVRSLDPTYNTQFHTRFLLDDLLSKGIQRYLDWLNSTKGNQIVRTQTAFFLVLILSAITVQFNLTHHKKELEILSARGASERQITKIILKDLAKIALASFSLSLGFGVLLSRFGLIATSYMTFDYVMIFSTPLLITFDTLILTGVMALAIPLVSTLILLGIPKVRIAHTLEEGRLAKLVRGISLVRWDFVLVGVSLVLLLLLWELGVIVSQVPVFSAVAIILPVIFMAGTANLIAKGIRYAAGRPSKGMRSNFSLVFGWRNLGSNTKHVGATILVIALGISLVWNNALVLETQPNTNLGHVRFAIGGDLTFKISTDFRDCLDDFKENVSSMDGVLNSTLIEVYSLSMSSSLSDTVSFVSVTPEEFAKVGYDSNGLPLVESHLMNILERLESQPAGAVVTSDISHAFAIKSGDTMRAFRENGTEIETKTFTVTDVVDALPDNYASSSGFPPPQSESTNVGKRRIWINQQYAEDALGSETAATLFLCVRLSPNKNGQEVLDDVLSVSNPEMIKGYSVASEYLEQSTSEAKYIFNQKIDTSMAFLVLLTIFCSLVLYISNTRSSRQSNETLLSVLGRKVSQLKWTNISEIVLLNLVAMALLLVCSPIMIQNTFYIILVTSNQMLVAYPQPVLPVFPILPLLTLFSFCLVLAVTIVELERYSLNKQNIAERSHEVWQVRPSFIGVD